MAFLIFIAVWIFCGIGASHVAQKRGANGCLWLGLGVVFGMFGLAFALAAGTSANPTSRRPLAAAPMLQPLRHARQPNRGQRQLLLSLRCSAFRRRALLQSLRWRDLKGDWAWLVNVIETVPDSGRAEMAYRD